MGGDGGVVASGGDAQELAREVLDEPEYRPPGDGDCGEPELVEPDLVQVFGFWLPRWAYDQVMGLSKERAGKLKACKIVRNETGLGLLPAKALVEEAWANEHQSKRA